MYILEYENYIQRWYWFSREAWGDYSEHCISLLIIEQFCWVKKYCGQIFFSLVIVKGPDTVHKNCCCVFRKDILMEQQKLREALETTAVMCVLCEILSITAEIKGQLSFKWAKETRIWSSSVDQTSTPKFSSFIIFFLRYGFTLYFRLAMKPRMTLNSLTIFLPQPSEWWDSRCEPSCLATSFKTGRTQESLGQKGELSGFSLEARVVIERHGEWNAIILSYTILCWLITRKLLV